MAKDRMTVAKAMVKCLENENITTVFGYPGAAICPFYDELLPSGIEHILVRHEVNGGHSASGYARITGKPAVCIATSGPGATNLITAIATAYMDSIPMVIITGQVNSDQIGYDVFQEADITGSAEPFVKHSYLVKNAEDIAYIFKSAFYIAGTGRPGPVLIDVPMDIQKCEIEFEYPETIDIRTYKPSITGNKLQVKRVCEAIMSAEKPLICAGGGLFASHAEKEMQKLAEICDIPVITTMMGISSIPYNNRLHFGMLGMFGKKVANRAVCECDLLILLGARVGDRAVTALKSRDNLKVVHIDIDPAEIGKSIPAAVPVVGDAATIIGQILEGVSPKKHNQWVSYLTDIKNQTEGDKPLAATDGTVNPKAFMKALNKHLPEHSVVVADVGQNQIWTCNNIELGEQGRFLTAGGMGTMGYSLPAAIGAKKADESAEVVAICGDGSFQMQLMELATAVQHNINVKIIVMVNNRLGMVREVQTNQYENHLIAVFLDGSPDFIKLAAAYGISGENVTDISQADGAVERMIKSDKPYMLQVFVDENEKTIL